MAKIIRAIFENGVFRPLDPLILQDQVEVNLVVGEPQHEEARQISAAAFPTFPIPADARLLTSDMVEQASEELP